jgi:hypothetical protein
VGEVATGGGYVIPHGAVPGGFNKVTVLGSYPDGPDTTNPVKFVPTKWKFFMFNTERNPVEVAVYALCAILE